jgi:hypothetical protein
MLNEAIGVNEACVITMDHKNVTEHSFQRNLEGKIRLGQASVTSLKYVENDV